MKRLSLWILFLAVLTACGWTKPVVTPTPLPAAATAVPTRPAPTAALPTSTAEAVLPPSPTAPAGWQWPRSTPEEQGLSSAVLADMLENIQQNKLNLHSVLVIRNGTLVMEAYLYPFNAQARHNLYSVTKSITSTLVGIAQADGLIDIQAPMTDYFTAVSPDDPRKAAITVEDVLSMSSGLEWAEPLQGGRNDHMIILQADDPAQYFFSPALAADPGTVFNYNSGGSHMLSILVQGVTGEKSAADFAKKRLFEPLDIHDYSWENDSSGHTMGGTGLEMASTDMAKIGQMFLDKGQWQGSQIVPAAWVETATQVHAVPSTEVNYGYQWWLRPQGDFYALGWGGQQIHVFPQQNMVVVFTAGLNGDAIQYTELIERYLLPAASSNESLPANETAQARLDQAIRALALPQQKYPVRPSAPLKNEVDGKQWLVTGSGTWSMFSLHFLNDNEARFDLETDADVMPLMVGLDGGYRVTDTQELGPVAMLGYWETADTFVIQQQNLREADGCLNRFKFSENSVKISSEWFVNPHTDETEAVLFGD